MSNIHQATHDRRKTDPIQDELNADVVLVDKKDPNYDSENDEQDDYFLQEMDVSTAVGDVERRPLQNVYAADHCTIEPPELPYEQFTKTSKIIVVEYLDDVNIAKASKALSDLKCKVYHDDFVYRAIRLSMDRDDSQQKDLCSLIAHLHAVEIISSSQMYRAFEKLIQIWDDLRLDVPNAPYQIFAILEQTVWDKVLHRQLLARCPEDLLMVLKENSVKADQTFPRLAEALETLQKFKHEVKLCVSEYFDATDIEEVKTTINELNHPELGHEWIRMLIRGALDGGKREKEKSIECICVLYPDYLSADDVQLGFSRLIGSIDDLYLDHPYVEQMLAKFLARGISEEFLPPVFLQDQLRIHTGRERGMHCVRYAQHLWGEGRSTNIRQLQRLWKVVPAHDIDQLKKNINNSIIEFLDSHDIEAACCNLVEMELSSEYYAEFIRKLLYFSLERGHKHVEAANRFIKRLKDTSEVTETEFINGFDEFADKLEDITCDVPQAGQKMVELVEEMKQYGVLPDSYTFKPGKKHG